MAFYYFSKRVLKMSDDEFWRSTPAKIFALLDYHAKVESPKEEPPKEIPKMTPEIFKAWS